MLQASPSVLALQGAQIQNYLYTLPAPSYPCQQDSWGGDLSEAQGLAIRVFRSPGPLPAGAAASEATKQPGPTHSLCLHLQQTASLAPQEEALMRKAVGQGSACLRL